MFEKQGNFAEFKAGYKHTQGQANLWLEIIGWVLWLQGEKGTMKNEGFLTVQVGRVCTKRDTPPNLEGGGGLRL